jgi:Na+/H+ antiporter NhaD/arsenite permease-like protein
MAAFPTVPAGVIAAGMGICHLAWLQLFRRLPGEKVLAEMDWGILVLFVGLFVLVGSVRDTVLSKRSSRRKRVEFGWCDVRPIESR